MRDLPDKSSVVPIRRLRTINQLLRCAKANYRREEEFQAYPDTTVDQGNGTVIRLGQDISKEIRRNSRQQR